MAKLNDFKNNKTLSELRTNADRAKKREIENLIKDFLTFNSFDKKWIKNGADEKMIDFSELLGYFLAPSTPSDKSALTKSQIRNVFGEIKRIQMKGFEVEKTAFFILKPKVAYNAGRHNKLGILTFKEYFNKAFSEVTNKEEFENFVNLFEAILAYHKAFGGKD